MKYIICIVFIWCFKTTAAQVFIDQGMIEYEVKVNNHKAMGEGPWADMMKDRIPKISGSYYQLTFNTDKSIYLFNRKDEKTKSPWAGEGEDNVWYNDYKSESFVQQKSVFGETYILTDSLIKIDWKMTNETREIAGFNCRKAVGKLFDSVYVFAFYTDEIAVSGGPMGLHGLPGMILGVTIPRMFSSWVATRLELNGVNYNALNPPSKGKKKKAKELQETAVKVTKDWGSWGQQAIWGIFL